MIFHDESADDISNESQSFSSNEERTTDAALFSNELGVSPNSNYTTNAESTTHQENNSTNMTLGDDSEEEGTIQSNNSTLIDNDEGNTTDIEIEQIQNGKICPSLQLKAYMVMINHLSF